MPEDNWDLRVGALALYVASRLVETRFLLLGAWLAVLVAAAGLVALGVLVGWWS